MLDPIGTCDMFSTPAAMTTSCIPLMTACTAKWMACCEDPHCRSTDVPGTLSGSLFCARICVCVCVCWWWSSWTGVSVCDRRREKGEIRILCTRYCQPGPKESGLTFMPTKVQVGILLTHCVADSQWMAGWGPIRWGLDGETRSYRSKNHIAADVACLCTRL